MRDATQLSQAPPLQSRCEGGAAALQARAPGVLHFTRYIHGEIKLSVGWTAGTAAAKCRVATGMRHYGDLPLKVREAKAAAWQAELDKGTRPGGGQETAALNSNGKFAEAEKGRPGYGRECIRKIFGPYNRLMVNEVCHVMEAKFGRQGLFLTFTIPGKGPVVEKAIGSWSGYIVKRVRQWFRDRLQAPHSVCGVWEFQRRGMLHLHIAVMSEAEQGLQEIEKGFREFWAGVLVRVMELSGVNVCAASEVYSWLPAGPNSQQDCKRIRKSVGRYMAKYVSKAPREAAKKVRYYPSRWVTVDRETHREAKAARVRMCMEGFSVTQWKVILAGAVRYLRENANSVKQFVNPYCPTLPGVMAWFEPGGDWSFLDDLCAVIDSEQENGTRLCYGR